MFGVGPGVKVLVSALKVISDATTPAPIPAKADDSAAFRRLADFLKNK